MRGTMSVRNSVLLRRWTAFAGGEGLGWLGYLGYEIVKLMRKGERRRDAARWISVV